MKRILGTVIALTAVLAFGTTSRAATFTFDVTGTGSVNSISSFAPSPPGYFINPFVTGSSVSVDITGGAVTLLGGTLNIVANNTLGALGSIDTNVVATLSGGSGTLSGSDILWSLASPTFLSTVGTFTLHGAICGIAGAPCDTPLPIAALTGLTGTVPVNPIIMGDWSLDAGMTTILGSSRATISNGSATAAPGPGLPAQWYLFGQNDLGHTIPEPGAFALVLLGIGGLGLRSRKA